MSRLYEVEMSVQFAVSKKEKKNLLWSVKFSLVNVDSKLNEIDFRY